VGVRAILTAGSWPERRNRHKGTIVFGYIPCGIQKPEDGNDERKLDVNMGDEQHWQSNGQRGVSARQVQNRGRGIG